MPQRKDNFQKIKYFIIATLSTVTATAGSQRKNNLQKITKYSIVATLAFAAAFFQISVMKNLVHGERFVFEKSRLLSVGKFIRIKQFREENEKNPLESPETVDAPPPAPPSEERDEPEIQETEAIDFSGFNPLGERSLLGFSFSDGDYLPIVKIPADYPEAALRKGIEGWVLVSFTISKTGAVKNPKVIKAQPPGFFERAAIRAVKKFKYKPKIVGGEAIEVEGVTNRIVFELGDEN